MGQFGKKRMSFLVKSGETLDYIGQNLYLTITALFSKKPLII